MLVVYCDFASLFIARGTNDLEEVNNAKLETIRNIKADVQLRKQDPHHSAKIITEFVRFFYVNLKDGRFGKFDPRGYVAYKHFRFQIYLMFFHDSNESININSQIYLINENKANPRAQVSFAMVRFYTIAIKSTYYISIFFILLYMCNSCAS